MSMLSANVYKIQFDKSKAYVVAEYKTEIILGFKRE